MTKFFELSKLKTRKSLIQLISKLIWRFSSACDYRRRRKYQLERGWRSLKETSALYNFVIFFDLQQTGITIPSFLLASG